MTSKTSVVKNWMDDIGAIMPPKIKKKKKNLNHTKTAPVFD